MIYDKGKYLVTPDQWFIAPDGKYYRSVWGEAIVLEDNLLGVKTNRNSTNWYLKIGSEEKHVIIAGCQIHYAVKCNKKPADGYVVDYNLTDNGCAQYTRPSIIYIAE